MAAGAYIVVARAVECKDHAKQAAYRDKKRKDSHVEKQERDGWGHNGIHFDE